MDNEILCDAVRRAKKLGAGNVDILLAESDSICVSTRLAKLEKVVQAEEIGLKVRVSIGARNAVVSTNNLDDLKSDSFIEKAVAAAKNAPEETAKIRPNPNELCKNFPDLDLRDNREISSEELIASALECETIALQIDGITNSEGAEAARSRSKITVMKDGDFLASYEKTLAQISVVTLAEKDGFLERAYDVSEAIHWSDLKSPEQIARRSAEKTLKKLGARKISSCKVPVIFDREVSRQLLRSFIEAINGAAIAKGVSFLKDKLSQKIFSERLNVVDRYSFARGLKSRPFDSDGLECLDTVIVKDGVLNSFLLNTKYADQLKMKSTGNARGFEEIAPNNVCIENGDESFQDLLKSVKSGLYLTEVLGNGLNLVTGNYSQGAVGFWIESGEIAYPVNEITIAGNFINMFSNCAIASDLKIERGIDAPTLLIDQMTVGGM